MPRFICRWLFNSRGRDCCHARPRFAQDRSLGGSRAVAPALMLILWFTPNKEASLSLGRWHSARPRSRFCNWHPQFKAKLERCDRGRKKRRHDEPSRDIKQMIASPTRAGDSHTYWLWFNLTSLINMEESWKGPIRSCSSNLHQATTLHIQRAVFWGFFSQCRFS